MEIRYYSSTDDKNAISHIYEESWRAAYRGIIPQAYLDAIPEGQWAGNLEIPGWSTLVCMEGQKYIGTSAFCASRMEQYKGCGEIISIYLLPEYLGMGYGKLLMDAALTELKKQGFAEVYLWVLEENDRARRFYEKYGFSCTDDSMSSKIGGKELKEIRYVYRFSD